MPEPSRDDGVPGAPAALRAWNRTPGAVFRTFLCALDDRDVGAAAGFVDRDRYREGCVGVTAGWVGRTDATVSPERVRRLPSP